MVEVNIESRRDYELFIKQSVAKLQISSKHKAIVRKIAMAGFDDGMAYQANSGGYVTLKES